MERHTVGESDAVNYLSTTLPQRIKSGDLPLTRVVLAFANPRMDPKTIMGTTDPETLVQKSGLLANPGSTGYQPGDGKKITDAIQQLKKLGVETYLSVGGLAYSCRDETKILNGGGNEGMCQASWPLTPDIGKAFKTAGLNDDIDGQVQPFDTQYSTISQYTDAWAHAAKSLGCAGIDMDAEEYWFASETTFLFPKLVKNPTWAKLPDGPFAIPYSVIKYAATLKALKASASSQGLRVSIAAPAVAAFDIHDHLGSSAYWCAVFNKEGKHVCGEQVGPPDYKDITVGGNLKGIFYDMTPVEILQNTRFRSPRAAFAQLRPRFSFPAECSAIS